MSDVILISIPRKQLDTWWHKPWEEVVAGAEQQIDGLRICKTRKSKDGDFIGAAETEPDTAYVREGVGIFAKGKTCLYLQNW